MGKNVLVFVRSGDEIFLESQAEKIQAYCEQREYNIVESVQVVGNCTLGQQMLKAALNNVKEKGIETVITVTPNHIGRSIVEMHEMQETFKAAGVTWESMDGAHRHFSLIGSLVALVENELPDDPDQEELQPDNEIEGMRMA